MGHCTTLLTLRQLANSRSRLTEGVASIWRHDFDRKLHFCERKNNNPSAKEIRSSGVSGMTNEGERSIPQSASKAFENSGSRIVGDDNSWEIGGLLALKIGDS